MPRKWVAKPKSNTVLASEHPSIRELAWVSGFLEGEGCFHRAKSSVVGCEMVSAPQKEIEPLQRLQQLLGGNICTKARIHVWQIYGTRARGVMMTLFPLMSRRRKDQIKLALRAF